MKVTVAGEQGPTTVEVTTGAQVGALPTSGGTVSGSLVINRFGAPVFPLGPTGAVPSLSIPSSYAGGDDNGIGTDSTGRINLYSYQRANFYGFGENIRNFAMRSDAKTMQAFYIPVQSASKKGGYNPATRDPMASGIGWKPVVWQGAHYESNGHESIHGHWELEIADSTGALQGRLEIPFIDQALDGTKALDQATIGVDYTNIRTNLADFSVRAQNITSGPYSGTNTALRVGGGNDRNKDIALSISSDMGTAGRRWILRANTTTEAGSNAGTDLQILRYDDTGAQLGTAVHVRRSDGNIALGSTSVTSARVTAAWGTSGTHGYSAIPSVSPGSSSAFDAQMTAATDRAFQAALPVDANRRWVVFADGKTEWGDGTAARDANLYRSNPGVLKTDGAVQATTSLRLNTTSLASGVGVIGIANATTPPSGTPTGGGVFYASAGLPRWKGSDGTDYDLTRGQFPITVARKTSDETVANSIIVQDDDQLTAAVAANGVYLVEAFLMYDGDTAGDFRVTFSGPTGASMDWTPNGLATSQVSGSASIKLERQNLNGESTLGASGAGSKAVAVPRGILLVGGTAGNLTVRWAQAAASATATTLFANSWLRLTKIA